MEEVKETSILNVNIVQVSEIEPKSRLSLNLDNLVIKSQQQLDTFKNIIQI